MQEKGLGPTPPLPPQAYSHVERVLRHWADEREDVLLISSTELPDFSAAQFLLYLAPEFKALARYPHESCICFDSVQIRTFSAAIQRSPQLPTALKKQLQQYLRKDWLENSAAQHSKFSLSLLQGTTFLSVDEIQSGPSQPELAHSEFGQSKSGQSKSGQPDSAESEALIAELQEAWEAVRIAEHAKAEFMALISHELRTPLTSVIGMSATMLRWAFGPLNERQRDCIQTIHRSGEHLMQMIDSILDLSQTSSGQASLNVQPFSLQRLIKNCVQLFQAIAEEQGIHLRASHRFTDAEDDLFMGDAQRLQQVVINLLDNAIKFTETEGTVQIQLSREETLLKLEVKDTGIGISPEDRDRLFQRFQQLEASHRRRFGGTGLGLALTKQIVDLHGGRIEIESNPGQGSCFTVWLPEQEPPLTSPPEKPQGEVVLLEEDDLTATLICELLTAAGYKVFWLVDSSTALEQIQMLHPVAVIVNLQFQGSGGEELVQHVHRIALDPKPKLIGLLPQELSNSTIRCPVEAVVYTPLNPEALVVHLNAYPSNVSSA